MRKCRVSSRFGPALSAVFSIQGKDIAPAGGTVFLAGAGVFVVGCDDDGDDCIERSAKQQKARGLVRPRVGSGCANRSLTADKIPASPAAASHRMARPVDAHQTSGSGSSQTHQGSVFATVTAPGPCGDGDARRPGLLPRQSASAKAGAAILSGFRRPGYAGWQGPWPARSAVPRGPADPG